MSEICVLILSAGSFRVEKEVYDEFMRLRRIEAAAKALVDEVRYIVGLPDDDPHKGTGNRLADVLANR